MQDRLHELLDLHPCLYGMICRDATTTDLELIAQAGYHLVWIDLEHNPQTNREALQLCRMITHLGMVPMVRMIELAKAQVQQLLDGGVELLALPDVRDASQAAEFVQLAKYPPIGKRGVSSTTPRAGFSLGDSPAERLRELNQATHLMVQFESEEAYLQLESILAVDGIDVVSVGQVDWGARLGIYGDPANSQLNPKIEKILASAKAANKLTLIGVNTTQEALRYAQLGVRILFVGLDIALKRKIFNETLERFQGAFVNG